MTIFNPFRVVVALVVAVAAYFAINDPSIERARSKDRARRAVVAYMPPPTSCIKDGQIAMTFDNGISTANTPAILDVLKSANATATFHVSTEWVGVYTVVDAILRRMIDEGHTVGFSWYGSDPRNMTDLQLASSLQAQATKIYNAISRYPRLIRLPYDMANIQVLSVAAAQDFKVTSYNLDPADYHLCPSATTLTTTSSSTTTKKTASALASATTLATTAPTKYTDETVVKAYTAKIDGFKAAGVKGAVIAVHNDLCPIASAIGRVISTVRAEGYQLVTLDKCLGGETPYKSVAGAATSVIPTYPAAATAKSSAAGASSDTTGATAGGITAAEELKKKSSATTSTHVTSTTAWSVLLVAMVTVSLITVLS
ncbi:hypothetical protein AMAG_13436 [Allomyces macrogynus ATCC 38327]|uniref:NodB homology domain-containing protein n=1 Tax=Allomyces macrogynus (strain ATCC 38327) TaxID=578462 RepID=A0A0L0T2A8_ALLM3|nr:hypothetical protein AMAG_13436 [Allomyces macrogynus ATCC 38327]|eukprot:KNE68795.1 hypothetical protein AMAG_13436 [Allomyces macrogynus ATCC 38327]